MRVLAVLIVCVAFRIAWTQTPVSFSTPKDEYAPSITADGRRMYFTAALPGGAGGLDVWYSDRDDSAWGEPVNAGAPVNTPKSEHACAISADGKTMVIAMYDQPEGFGDCDLYISTLQRDGTWGKPQNLGATVNSSSWESFPSISRDGRSIYFSSDRAGGVGSFDIYVTTRTTNNEWSDPVNVTPINTPGNDVTPYIALDDSTLYYASDGFSEERSDLDIYMSRRVQGVWTAPVPVKPVNTPANEWFPTMSGNQRVMYFSSNRKGKSRGMDIFEMELPEEFSPHHGYTALLGKVADRENNLPIGATVVLNADEGDSASTTGESNPLTGEFEFVVPRGHTYRLQASTRDCYLGLADVRIDSGADERVECKLALERLQIGKPHIAERMFQEGTDLLTREGQAEIRKLNTLFLQDRTLRTALFVNNEESPNDTLLRQLRIDRLRANLRRVNRDLKNIDWKPQPFQGETLEPKRNYIVLVPILN